MTEALLDDVQLACPCGCGRTFSPVGSRGRRRGYFSPACSLRVNRRSGGRDGQRHTPEAKVRMSAAARGPRPHLRGERNGMYGRVGPLNPNYIDGSSPERQRAYASSRWREVSRFVLERDGYRCVRCQAPKRGPRTLHVHHIEPWAGNPELRFDPDNLETLCRGCHHAAHRRGGDANE